MTTTAPALSMCEIIRTLCILLQSVHKLAKQDISFVAGFFSSSREPGLSSSQESVRPEANRGPNILSHYMCMKVEARVWHTVFTWPRAVRGWCKHTPPSTTNNRAEVVRNIVEDHKVI